jgi:hypothetical protein
LGGDPLRRADWVRQRAQRRGGAVPSGAVEGSRIAGRADPCKAPR